MPAHGHGLSLLELLVALSIMVILAAIAAPASREYLRNCQRSAVVNAVVHAIHAARASAANSGTPVVLCGTEDLMFRKAALPSESDLHHLSVLGPSLVILE